LVAFETLAMAISQTIAFETRFNIALWSPRSRQFLTVSRNYSLLSSVTSEACSFNP